MKYRISGVIEVNINAASPREAIDIAQARIEKLLDTHARRLEGACGMDGATDAKTGEYLI